ncbi:MAG: hypothetical protein NE327_09620 [Lentisphaeraceae bacterium]|nr:hypothetical protein [Lentisphaeraceae bacterium]
MNDQYKIIDDLKSLIKNLVLSISKSPQLLEDDGHFYERIRISRKETIIDFPIMDEFSDIEKGNTVVLLNFILQECVFYEEAMNYKVWCEDIGIDLEKQSSQNLYKELSEKVPEVRSLLGSNAKPVDYYHIEFNTDVAQTLRDSNV